MPTKQEERKSLVRRTLKESFDGDDTDVLGMLCAPDVVHHTALREDITGLESFVAFVEEFHDAFADLSFAIESAIAEGDTVAIRGAVSGTHVGEFQCIAPTEASVQWDSHIFARVEDGQITETWALSDTLGLTEQLGGAPSMP